MRTVLMCLGCQLAFPDIYQTPGSHFSLEKQFPELWEAIFVLKTRLKTFQSL